MYKPILNRASNKYGNNRWDSESIKMQRIVYLDSNLEYEHWLTLECNPNVLGFCEQPFEIRLILDGVIRKSIPDMWVLFKDGTEEIREVKYSRDLNSPKVIEQIRIQKAYCEANNLKFQTITENELRISKNLLSNYKLIIKNLKNTKSFDEKLLCNLKNTLKNKPLTIEQLEQELFTNQKHLISHIALMLFRGDIKADLENGYFGKKLEVYHSNV